LTCSLFFLIVLLSLAACKKKYLPKPRGYFRIDFPEKKYQYYKSDCDYSFEYPVYGKIVKYDNSDAGPCWINIEFPPYKGKIHITYWPLEDNLYQHVEDVRSLAYKHIIKADDIIESQIMYPERNVYGIFYTIKGNTASSASFFITDSTQHFLSGALYFSVRPNSDSLAPVINFFKKDMQHLIKTFEWN
jgi:gliding motility-associated lipoprotein GldD